jgi:hypothetical protein
MHSLCSSTALLCNPHLLFQILTVPLQSSSAHERPLIVRFHVPFVYAVYLFIGAYQGSRAYSSTRLASFPSTQPCAISYNLSEWWFTHMHLDRTAPTQSPPLHLLLCPRRPRQLSIPSTCWTTMTRQKTP